MIQILFYNESGEILYNSVNSAGHEEIPSHLPSNLNPLVFENVIDIVDCYFDGNSIIPKSKLIIPENILTNETISIPNVVPYDVLFIDGEKFVLDDNVLDLEFETIGTYEIRFMLSRYIHEIKTVIVS
jgi:hypothetical protein